MASLNQIDNPYVGPRTFRPEERAKFFGRSREARELTSLIIANRLVLFYSPSGAGKSSLLNTMVGPMLTEAGFEVLPTGRVSGYSGKEATADNIYIYNLLLSIQDSEDIPAEFATLTLAQFLDNLVQHSDSAYYYDPAYVYPPDTVFKPRVLIIDQFEELVTTNPTLWPQRAAFFEQLKETLTHDRKLWVLLTLREDYVANFDPYLHLTPNRLRHRYYMERLARTAAIEAIQKPVEEIRPFTPEAVELLADNLLRIRSADGQTNGQFAQFVEPVQLQAVCYQMWSELSQQSGDSITADDVARFADVDKALTRFYEDTVKKLVVQTGVSEVVLREWFEHQLITEAKTRNMVYRGEETTGDLPTPTAEAALACFILREEVRPGGIWYELVHDRLVEPILKANQAWRLKQPLPRLARHWHAAGRAQSELLHEQDLKRLTATSDWQLLGPLVTEFVAASETAVRTKQERARNETLKHHRKLAEAERQRAEAERQRAETEQQRAEEAESAKRKRDILTALAFSIALVAVIFMMTAINSDKKAQEQSEKLAWESTRAAQNEAQAEAVAKEARAAESEAREEEARAKRAEEKARGLTALAEARRLTYPADQFLANGNFTAGLLVGLEIHNRVQEAANIEQEISLQEKYGVLWLALNAAANHKVPNSDAFRQPVLNPIENHAIDAVIVGPSPNTLASLQGDKIIWWEVDANTPVSQTYSLPFTITHAVFDGDDTLIAAAGSTVYRLHRQEDAFEPRENDTWPLDDDAKITAVTISHDRSQLAVAFCIESGSPTQMPGQDRDSERSIDTDEEADNQDSNVDEQRKENDQVTSEETAEAECFIQIKAGDDLSTDISDEIRADSRQVTGMSFIEYDNSKLAWSNEETIYLTTLDDQQETIQLLPNSDLRYRALTTVNDMNWLVIAGCSVQADPGSGNESCDEGFIRWWNINQETWLPTAARLTTPIEHLLYLPAQQALISVHTNEINKWNTGVEEWPQLACQMAGRNLTSNEWRLAFPNQGEAWQETFSHGRNPLDPQVTCRDYGLDISFATEALLRCEDQTRSSANQLYNRFLHPADERGLVKPFEVWATSLLFQTALAHSDRATDCLTIASAIDNTTNSEELLALTSQINALYQWQIKDKIGNEMFTQAIDEVAALVATTSLSSEIAAMSDFHLTALYAEACAMRLTIREQSPACLTFDQLQQQALNYDFAHVVTVPGEVGQWLFYGQGEQFISIGYSGPSLFLHNAERRRLAEGNNSAAPNRAGQLPFRLPESGVYHLKTDPFATSLEAPPVISAYEPPELPFDELLVGLQQEIWRITAEPGTTIAINVTGLHTGDLFDLELLVRNEQWQTIPLPGLNVYAPSLQFTLPDAGDYYISLNWHHGDPSRHSVSFSLIDPEELVPGNPVLANAADRFWEFTGRGGSPVQLELHAEGANGLPRLLLYDEQGNLLTANNNDNGESDIRLDVLLANAGVYRAEVDSGETADPYTITLTFIEPQLITFSSEIEADPSQRWWQFEGRAEEVVAIGVEAFESLEMETMSYPSLWVYDADGVLIAWDDNWWNEPNVLVQVLLPESGLYMIQINWAAEPTGYQLALNLAEIDEPDHIDEQDYSDIAAEAEMILYGQTRQGSPEQRRWQFEANRGDFISIAMDSVDHDPYLRLFDANGEQVAFDDDGGVGLNALIQFLILEDGFYEIDAGWFGSSSPGPYTLALVETMSLQISQTITANTQERIWQFNGQEGQIVSILPEAIEATTPYVTVLDAQGNHLLTNYDEQDAFWYVWLPDNGIYYIVANWYDMPGLYRLTLNELNPVVYPQIVTAVTSEQVRFLLRQGRITEGLALFQRNQNMSTDTPASDYNELCRFGSLWGYAADVMFACQTAVFLDPNNPDYIDSRGVARAMIGDFEGAIADFRHYTEFGSFEVERRHEWIADLTTGINPFDDEALLEELRR